MPEDEILIVQPQPSCLSLGVSAVPFHLQFGISVGEELLCSSDFCSAPCEKLVVMGREKWSSFQRKISTRAHYYPRVMFVKWGEKNLKKKKEKEMFVFPENYSCIYKNSATKAKIMQIIAK